MYDICMLVSEECNEALVNNSLFWLYLFSEFLLLFPHLFLCSFFSGVREIWIIVLQCIIYDNSHSAVGSRDWRYAEGEPFYSSNILLSNLQFTAIHLFFIC